MSFNINGLFTRVPCGSKKVSKHQLLGSYLRTHGISFVGVQEHHLTTHQFERCMSNYLGKIRYECMFNPNLAGRGGRALVWNQERRCISAFSLSCCILVATLENMDGQRLHVLSVHFHHEHRLRREQWLQIDKCSAHLRGHVIMLADHNSLIVPARDANKPAEEKKNEILAAGDTEVTVLAKVGLTDAWPEIHHASPDSRVSPPVGYTYGY